VKPGRTGRLRTLSGAMSGKWRGAEVAGGESEKSCRCVPVTLDGPRSRPHMLLLFNHTVFTLTRV
jgi:hypothetical protein